MNKLVAAVSVLTLLSGSALPAMAQGNGDSAYHGQKIKAHFAPHNHIRLIDIEGNWAEAYIMDLMEKGVLTGMDAYHFRPNTSVSRAQWAVMVSRYFDLKSDATTQDFADVPVDAWEYPYVEATKDYFDA